MVGEYWVHYKTGGKWHKFASADTPKRTVEWARQANKHSKGSIYLTPRDKPKKIRFKRRKGDATTDMFGGAFKYWQ
jgi:hypothetical protein